ncbi:Rieske 2Fe-2S domain-containing protein [Sulfuracidifex tepidarius]|uniref:Cytochrome b6-f complex iron-sulfur subunit n=1 Tax=Sulfuracidifex tepidarius TaxID=1294262 RepID=A0A510DX89_9CREN|nr:Rieske 2Fe-2S domain-containing protein [Sulfuracidifex tepidarius]BBG24851.1 Cytochrome b6-f complex iron-sulfur subunit [Sulfuracidifex tepidarius]BBG27635.1 Cytochrome b6-f complex iron-sulfur subunit [Sulfuracidifex tepidarius]
MLSFHWKKGDKKVMEWDQLRFVRELTIAIRTKNFDPREFIRKGDSYLFNFAEKNTSGLDEGRRNFLKAMVIGVGVATVAGIVPGLRVLVPPNVSAVSAFPKSLLVDSSGNPIKASSLPVNSPIITIYYYPLSGEPNFLLNLGDSSGKPVSVPSYTVTVPQTGDKYTWPGGVGPNKSIVSYSAICQHLGCKPPFIHFYPPKYVTPSQINAPEPDTLTAQAIANAKAANAPTIIHCDCHGSTYDPYHGAQPLTGPTQRPLPTTILEWDSSTDYLYALGSLGVGIYPEGANGVPSKDPTVDLSSSFGSSVGDKTEVSDSENPFSS